MSKENCRFCIFPCPIGGIRARTFLKIGIFLVRFNENGQGILWNRSFSLSHCVADIQGIFHFLRFSLSASRIFGKEFRKSRIFPCPQTNTQQEKVTKRSFPCPSSQGRLSSSQLKPWIYPTAMGYKKLPPPCFYNEGRDAS